METADFQLIASNRFLLAEQEEFTHNPPVAGHIHGFTGPGDAGSARTLHRGGCRSDVSFPERLRRLLVM